MFSVKTKLSQVLKCLCDWDHEWRITLAWKWSYVWLVCQYVLQSQRYAAMRIGCYEPVYNFIQILDLLKPNFEKSYGRMRRKWGNFPNIPGRISREWFELLRRNSGCWSIPPILTVVFRCFRRGMVKRSQPQFPEIRCWANGVQLQDPPNDKFDFFDGKRRRKGAKVEEPEF